MICVYLRDLYPGLSGYSPEKGTPIEGMSTEEEESYALNLMTDWQHERSVVADRIQGRSNTW